MRLERDDAIKISELYSLGNFKKVMPLKGGLSNYNFELTTNKGNFIVRFSSSAEKEELENIKIQLKAINFLFENGFEYDLTVPLKDNKGKYIGKINGKNFWIYEKIKGDTYEDSEKVDIKQLARMIAKYHIIMDKMPMGGTKSNFYDYGFIEKGLKEMELKIKEKKEKNEIDVFIEENFNYLEKGFERISKIDFGKNFIITHSDWCVFNLIFDRNKIKGLIDFDMFQIAPYTNDIAIAVKEHCVTEDWEWDNKKVNLFFNEYEKIRPIENFEKSQIKDLIVRDSIGGVINFYFHKKKVNFDKRLFMIKWFIIPLKNFLKDIEKKDYY